MTRKVIDELAPSFHVSEIRQWQKDTSEAVTVILKKGAVPLGGFYDIEGWANLAMKGGVLSMKQLLEILYNLQIARHAHGFLTSDLPPLPRIHGLAEVIAVHKALEQEIDRCILSEDEMADSASPELRSIRRKISSESEAIRGKMNSILASADSRGLLQDSLVTMRQGRYVIPVKQEHKSKVPGIIHDQSSTGATLFIEPQAIVNMNNELRELELAEKKEIHRILSLLSAEVAESGQGIRNNQAILVELDFLFAKGRLSSKWNCSEPDMDEKGSLDIRQGRHPLIDPRRVVPISVSLGKTYDTLIITGPNTGGKTVTLKTVGLFALMAQSGLHLPAGSGTRVPVFQRVFADIGDEQSIEQSLSTFSSHMTNIVDIVKQAGEDTLVLLDELGAGTDPTEGAALAIAILNDLYGRGAKTLATTHYTELKKYAIATAGVMNASMEFNVETLSPTYRLTVGTPGRSNAFEISRKLGLPDHLIDYARGLLTYEDIAFEEVISSIEVDRKRAEAERDEAISLNLEIKRQKAELDQLKQKLADQKEGYLAKAKEEARETIKEAKEFADQVQRELKELESVEDRSERNRRQESIRRNIRDKQNRYRETLAIPENQKAPHASDLKLGDRVKVLTLDQKGSVISLPDEKNEIQVQVGLMKVSVGLDQITKIDGSGEKSRGDKTRYSTMYQSKVKSVLPTYNVVGKVLDDALLEVDKYLDDAFMGGLKEVTIIHGRGAGILREGLHQMFKSHKHVAGSRKGSYNEGGDGVTVVTLR